MTTAYLLDHGCNHVAHDTVHRRHIHVPCDGREVRPLAKLEQDVVQVSLYLVLGRGVLPIRRRVRCSNVCGPERPMYVDLQAEALGRSAQESLGSPLACHVPITPRRAVRDAQPRELLDRVKVDRPKRLVAIPEGSVRRTVDNDVCSLGQVAEFCQREADVWLGEIGWDEADLGTILQGGGRRFEALVSDKAIDLADFRARRDSGTLVSASQLMTRAPDEALTILAMPPRVLEFIRSISSGVTFNSRLMAAFSLTSRIELPPTSKKLVSGVKSRTPWGMMLFHSIATLFSTSARFSPRPSVSGSGKAWMALRSSLKLLWEFRLEMVDRGLSAVLREVRGEDDVGSQEAILAGAPSSDDGVTRRNAGTPSEDLARCLKGYWLQFLVHNRNLVVGNDPPGWDVVLQTRVAVLHLALRDGQGRFGGAVVVEQSETWNVLRSEAGELVNEAAMQVLSAAKGVTPRLAPGKVVACVPEPDLVLGGRGHGVSHTLLRHDLRDRLRIASLLCRDHVQASTIRKGGKDLVEGNVEVVDRLLEDNRDHRREVNHSRVSFALSGAETDVAIGVAVAEDDGRLYVRHDADNASNRVAKIQGYSAEGFWKTPIEEPSIAPPAMSAADIILMRSLICPQKELCLLPFPASNVASTSLGAQRGNSLTSRSTPVANDSSTVTWVVSDAQGEVVAVSRVQPVFVAESASTPLRPVPRDLAVIHEQLEDGRLGVGHEGVLEGLVEEEAKAAHEALIHAVGVGHSEVEVVLLGEKTEDKGLKGSEVQMKHGGTILPGELFELRHERRLERGLGLELFEMVQQRPSRGLCEREERNGLGMWINHWAVVRVDGLLHGPSGWGQRPSAVCCVKIDKEHSEAVAVPGYVMAADHEVMHVIIDGEKHHPRRLPRIEIPDCLIKKVRDGAAAKNLEHWDVDFELFEKPGPDLDRHERLDSDGHGGALSAEVLGIVTLKDEVIESDVVEELCLGVPLRPRRTTGAGPAPKCSCIRSSRTDPYQGADGDGGASHAALAALLCESHHEHVGCGVVALSAVSNHGSEGRHHDEEVEGGVIEELVQELCASDLWVQNCGQVLKAEAIEHGIPQNHGALSYASDWGHGLAHFCVTLLQRIPRGNVTSQMVSPEISAGLAPSCENVFREGNHSQRKYVLSARKIMPESTVWTFTGTVAVLTQSTTVRGRPMARRLGTSCNCTISGIAVWHWPSKAASQAALKIAESWLLDEPGRSSGVVPWKYPEPFDGPEEVHFALGLMLPLLQDLQAQELCGEQLCSLLLVLEPVEVENLQRNVGILVGHRSTETKHHGGERFLGSRAPGYPQYLACLTPQCLEGIELCRIHVLEQGLALERGDARDVTEPRSEKTGDSFRNAMSRERLASHDNEARGIGRREYGYRCQGRSKQTDPVINSLCSEDCRNVQLVQQRRAGIYASESALAQEGVPLRQGHCWSPGSPRFCTHPPPWQAPHWQSNTHGLVACELEGNEVAARSEQPASIGHHLLQLVRRVQAIGGQHKIV
uniref:Uncharacterized protein n=1 Tax=Fungal sp. (strain NRRL 50135) TaxID=1547289 RepID=A0A089FND7_FUNXX|nr:hypothetical protein gNR594 [fungal sp. NRRL 50135]